MKPLNIVKAVIIVAVGSAIAIPSMPMADESKFDEKKGWTKDMREEAWATYNITKWGDVPGILFDADGSFAKAKVDKTFRASWLPKIKSALKEIKTDSKFKKANYSELFLAMADQLHSEGTGILTSWKMKDKARENDPSAPFNMQDLCFMQKITDMDTGPKSEKDSLKIMMERFFSAEQAYFNASDRHNNAAFTYSLFDSTSSELHTIIQATIYGSGYAEKTASYSEKNAKKYREENGSTVHVSYDSFADDVIDNYKTVKGKGHVVEG
jgi:hypothetical protein